MEYSFSSPVSEEQARKLKIGDTLYLDGIVFTARDSAHRRALEWRQKGLELPLKMEGLAMFHCGPIVEKKNEAWKIVSAGPTTSSRMETYESDFLRAFRPLVIVGKGGMGEKTLAALQEVGAVYCSFTGGAGALAAQAFKEVKGVHWLDLGVPEALWVIEAEHFGPLTVAMDSHRGSLYSQIDRAVQENLQRMLISFRS